MFVHFYIVSYFINGLRPSGHAVYIDRFKTEKSTKNKGIGNDVCAKQPYYLDPDPHAKDIIE